MRFYKRKTAQINLSSSTYRIVIFIAVNKCELDFYKKIIQFISYEPLTKCTTVKVTKQLRQMRQKPV